MIREIFLKIRAMTGGPVRLLAMLVLCVFCFLLTDAVLTNSTSDTIALACVDEDATEISAELIRSLTGTEGLSVTSCGSAEAQLLLKRGRLDGILILDSGFEKALLNGGELPVSLVSASGSTSSRAIVEIVSGAVLSLQSRYDAEARLAADGLWNEDTEAQYEEYYLEAEQTAVPAAIFETVGAAEDPTEAPVFGEFYAGYAGIAGMLMLLCLLSLTSWLSEPATNAVRIRCRSIRYGRWRALFSDFFAVFFCALLMSVAALLCKQSTDPTEWLAYVCYAVCISGLTLSLRRLNVSGGINTAAPFVAIISSVLGGCFFDFETLGGYAAWIPLITPQGHLIRAVRGGLSSLPVMVIAGVLLALCSLERKGEHA